MNARGVHRVVSGAVAAALLGLVGSALPGAATQAAPLVNFQMFDGHLHLVADDQVRYPRVSAGMPPPGAAGGLPPGAGGQAGSSGPAEPRAQTDVTRVVTWMKEQGVAGIAAIQKRGSYGTDNSYTLDAADLHKDLIAPVVILDAQQPDTPATLARMIRERGVAGIRLTGSPSADGTFPWLSSPQALKVWEVANQAGIVLDIMITNQDNSLQGVPEILRLARAYPNVRLVLDHALFPKAEAGPAYGINAAYSAMARQQNIYLKFTVINLDILREAKLSAPDFVRRLVDVYGADHVLWGSDLGNSSGSYQSIVARIVAATAKLKPAEQRKVLHDTGAKLFVRGGTTPTALVVGAASATPVSATPASAPVVPASAAGAGGAAASGEAAAQAAPQPAPPYGLPITLAQARLMAGVVETEAARRDHQDIVLAIVQPGGDLVYFAKMDDSTSIAIDWAQKKARMAARYRSASGNLPPNGEALPDAVPLGGGLPIVYHGKTIGGIGIDGFGHGQNAVVAQLAIDALGRQ